MFYLGFDEQMHTLRALILGRAHAVNPDPHLPAHMPGDYLALLDQPLPDLTVSVEEILATNAPAPQMSNSEASIAHAGLPLMFGFKFTGLLNDEVTAFRTYDTLFNRLNRSHLRNTAPGVALAPLLMFLQDSTPGIPTTDRQPSGEFIQDLRRSVPAVITYLQSLPAATPRLTGAAT